MRFRNSYLSSVAWLGIQIFQGNSEIGTFESQVIIRLSGFKTWHPFNWRGKRNRLEDQIRINGNYSGGRWGSAHRGGRSRRCQGSCGKQRLTLAWLGKKGDPSFISFWEVHGFGERTCGNSVKWLYYLWDVIPFLKHLSRGRRWLEETCHNFVICCRGYFWPRDNPSTPWYLVGNPCVDCGWRHLLLRNRWTLPRSRIPLIIPLGHLPVAASAYSKYINLWEVWDVDAP